MKGFIIYFLMLQLLSVYPVPAQSVNDTCSYKRGIYLTYEEFLKNMPSYKDSFQLNGKRRLNKVFNAYNDFLKKKTMYLFAIHGPKGKNINEAKLAWGASSGKNLYIRFPWSAPSNRYLKILYAGRYLYFIDYESGIEGASSSGMRYSYLVEYILDINDGEIYQLTDDLLKRILSSDQELFRIYENDANRKEKKVYYIKEYSLRHKDEIKVQPAFLNCRQK